MVFPTNASSWCFFFFFVVLTFYACFLQVSIKTMRCLYCGVQLQHQNSLKSHYKLFHKINTSNWFFKALFEENKGDFFSRKCYHFEKFLTSRLEEKQHNFLEHYQNGGEIPMEHRPIIIKK